MDYNPKLEEENQVEVHGTKNPCRHDKRLVLTNLDKQKDQQEADSHLRDPVPKEEL